MRTSRPRVEQLLPWGGACAAGRSDILLAPAERFRAAARSISVTLAVGVTLEGCRVTRDEEFHAFVVGAQGRLLHMADLLTGDRGQAEDLVQVALVKTYRAWRRVADGNPEAYARAVMVNARRDWWRRRTWREQPTSVLPERASADQINSVVERDVVLAALSRLTVRERQVVVLRHYVGLTEPETARELGCAVGTVKSATARALAKLRRDETLRQQR